jgi:adhesin transport system outer membrane protein
MKKFTFLCFLTLSSSLQAENTLTEVIQHTLKTNPDVLITINNRRAAEQEVKQAQGGYWPSIELTGGYGREISDNVTTRRAGGEKTLARQEIGITLTQKLFDGFSVKHKVAQQNALLNSETYKVKNTIENIALLTTELYLEILRRQEILNLSKDNVVVHQKTYEQVHILVTGGAGQKADLQQSTSRLALAKSNLVNAQGHLYNAQVKYQRITDEFPNPETLIMPARTPIEAALPASVDIAEDIALMNHPSLKVVQTEFESAIAANQHAQSAFMPRLFLELGTSKNENLDGIEGDNDDVNVMLRMRYNLYRGGADKARSQETAERMNAAKEVIRRTQRIVKENILLAWNNLITIRARLGYLRTHFRSTQEVLESYKEQFKLGRRSLLDVLDSENELFNARASLVTAQYTEMLSIFQLLESMGLLLDTLGIERPKEAHL